MKVFTPPVFNHLSWHGAVCPCSCFFVQQMKFEHPLSCKATIASVKTFRKSHVPNWFTYEGFKQKIIHLSKLFKSFVLSTYQALEFANVIFGWCWKWKVTVSFCSTTASWKRRCSAPLFHFTLLYLMPLVYLELWFWIRISNLKKKLGSKLDFQKLQRLQTQNLSSLHVDSRWWRHLLDSKTVIGLWTWHTLINYSKIKEV